MPTPTEALSAYLEDLRDADLGAALELADAAYWGSALSHVPDGQTRAEGTIRDHIEHARLVLEARAALIRERQEARRLDLEERRLVLAERSAIAH